MEPMAYTTDVSTSGAPGELERVRRFVNSYDAETDEEQLSSPGALAEWLASERLCDEPGELTERDVQRAVAFREALRAALIANNSGEPLDEGTVARMNEALQGAALVPAVAGDGSISFEPAGRGVGAALATLAAIAREAMATGEWARLKVCPADDCLWAFYDTSRNRSKRWCSMEVCGNRHKVRAYRDRSHA